MGYLDEVNYGADTVLGVIWWKGGLQVGASNLLLGQFDSVLFHMLVIYKKSTSYYLFLGVTIVRTILVISRGDWLGVWVGLEVNLFSVIPLLFGGGSSFEAGSSVKYYLVQAVGSVSVLVGVIANIVYIGLVYVEGRLIVEVGFLLVLTGLIVKMGLVPFHFWIPSVMIGLSWESCFVLSVWQKIALLFVLIGIVDGFLSIRFMVVGCLGSLVGGLGGMCQTQVRGLLGYSSINHGG